MQVVCQDGTIFQCAGFRAIDSGVLLFEEAPGGESDAEDEEGEEIETDEITEEAIGFVPIQQIRYVVSDALLEPGAGPQGAPARSPGQRTGAAQQTGAPGQSAQPAAAQPQSQRQHHAGAPPTGGQTGTGTGRSPTGTDQQPQGR